MSRLTDRIKEIKDKKAMGPDEFEYNLQEPVVNPNQFRLDQAPYTPSTLPHTTSNEEAYYGEFDWSLLGLVKQTSQAPIDDTIVQQVDKELIDIEAKLVMIDFLKKMDKPLRKRAKVLLSLKDKLQEAREGLVEVGATTLEPLSKQDADQLVDYIADYSTKTANGAVPEASSEPLNRLSDFIAEE